MQLHNLKNYDAHHILRGAKTRHGKMSCIPTNTEKYITFKVGGVTFKDSYAFMQSSLDKLVSNLHFDQLINTISKSMRQSSMRTWKAFAVWKAIP